MKKFIKYKRKNKIIYMTVGFSALILNILFWPNIHFVEETGDNLFRVSLNNISIGTVGDLSILNECMREARLSVAKNHEDMVLIDANITVQGQEVLFGRINSANTIEKNMKKVLENSVRETLNQAYTVKIGEYIVNLDNVQEVESLLQACVDKYDTANEFVVDLVLNADRELNVLTTNVALKQAEKEENPMKAAGMEKAFQDILNEVEVTENKEFSEYDLGLKEIDFEATVEVVESYLLEEELTSIDVAIKEVTKEQDQDQIYKVQAGDSLSLISLNTNIPMDKIIEMNDSIETEFSTIKIGQEITITIPEPNVSMVRMEEVYLEEDYDSEVEYVLNDDWYTNEKVTLQEPSAGHRKAVSTISYRNDKEVEREVLKEELILEAVAKIVEKGTIIPPTYIKPIAGGRLTSSFGKRSAPKRGASTNHGALDWGVPVGSAVWASSAGTVTKAGWAGGYGYVVYIDHGDGRQTRYAHLSKVLVKPGQFVDQGERIALSGNTGISTGPHIHFELRINGVKVNPLDHMN